MATYSVMLPITGYVVADVEADSEKEAIEKALDLNYSAKDIEEWEVHEYTNRGNVAYGVCTEASAEKLDD
ncbi:hypothetical protein ABC766_00505 [Methylobacterium fujisawaense]|uniref:hypothetical protein n=1 Tax=Methylobacterium fujisawaense TaxID=107400 RepID=UPI0031F4B184